MKIHLIFPILIFSLFLTNCSTKTTESVSLTKYIDNSDHDEVWNINAFAEESALVEENSVVEEQHETHFGTCPVCHEDDQIIPIVYGKPTEQALNEENTGKIALGGCVVSKDSPKFFCKRDKIRF